MNNFLPSPKRAFADDLSELPAMLDRAHEYAREASANLPPDGGNLDIKFWNTRCLQSLNELGAVSAAISRDNETQRRAIVATAILLASLCGSCRTLSKALHKLIEMRQVLPFDLFLRVYDTSIKGSTAQRIDALSQQARFLITKLYALEEDGDDPGEEKIIFTIARAAAISETLVTHIEQLELLRDSEHDVTELVKELGGSTEPAAPGCGCPSSSPTSNRH